MLSARQAPAVRSVEEKTLRAYVGTYEWKANDYVYLQMWNELTGSNQLVAFDESGELRALYPTDGNDHFFAGPGAAVPSAIESRVNFRRDANGRIASLGWQRGDSAPRTARRVDIERREDVSFANGDIRLAGTLISPNEGGKHPAMVLVPASGAENREYLVPFVHFLMLKGIALLGYDKRGVGSSTGDWKTESFDDLATDAVAAFDYLKTRPDIDPSQIGLFGLSQAGWVMPLAAERAKGLAFLISISGAGIPPFGTTIDETRNEMAASGLPQQAIEQVVALMQLEYRFAQTGQGWEDYTAAREKLAARMGKPPSTFPGNPDDPYWSFIRRIYFYDPAPALRQLRVPTLALFGELDDNIVAQKNMAAWRTALQAGGNRDYALALIPKADHIMLEARTGNNTEEASLRRFAPDYFTTVQDWLAKRIHRFHAP